MFVWNTSGYEGALVRRLVRAGFGDTPSRGLLVWVRRGREALSAMSYDHVPELADDFPPLVGVRDCAILRVGPQRRFPCSGRYPDLRGAPDYRVRCWHEAVLVLAAHEAGHIEAFRRHRSAIRQLARGKSMRVARDSELACERRAVTALRLFRREHRCATTRGR
jgi:hypothetical protein